LDKSDFSVEWVGFYDNSATVSPTKQNNLVFATNGNPCMVVAESNVLGKLYEIDDSDGTVDTIHTIPTTDAPNGIVPLSIVEGDNYMWIGGGTVDGSFVVHTDFWRLDKDLTNQVKTQLTLSGNPYALGISGIQGDYITSLLSNGSLASFDISTGAPSYLAQAGSLDNMGKIVASNSTRWMVNENNTAGILRTISRRQLNITQEYGQSRGAVTTSDQCGDMRYINSKFYSLFYDESESKFVVDRYADQATYSLEASSDVTPDSILDCDANQHSFIDWGDSTQGLLVMAINGAIDSSVTGSGNLDIAIKLFDLPTP